MKLARGFYIKINAWETYTHSVNIPWINVWVMQIIYEWIRGWTLPTDAPWSQSALILINCLEYRCNYNPSLNINRIINTAHNDYVIKHRIKSLTLKIRKRFYLAKARTNLYIGIKTKTKISLLQTGSLSGTPHKLNTRLHHYWGVAVSRLTYKSKNN